MSIEGQEVQKKVTSRDISAYGGYFLTDTGPLGDRVELRLETPFETIELRTTLEMVGTVIRVDQLSQETCGFATKFEEMPSLVDSLRT